MVDQPEEVESPFRLEMKSNSLPDIKFTLGSGRKNPYPKDRKIKILDKFNHCESKLATHKIKFSRSNLRS